MSFLGKQLFRSFAPFKIGLFVFALLCAVSWGMFRINLLLTLFQMESVPLKKNFGIFPSYRRPLPVDEVSEVLLWVPGEE